MKTILVDDAPLAMERFSRECRGISEINIVGRFDTPLAALEYARQNTVELAVLDIEMADMSGLALANALQGLFPNIVIIFITGHRQYALDAFAIHAAAYLLKPYNREEIQYALQTANLLTRRKQPKIVIRTFGAFDVFVGGKPLYFKSSKAKELLAVLVDAQGGTVSSERSISLLWEYKPFDENAQSLYYKAAKSLENCLEEAGIGYILLKMRYARSIDVHMISCDYYDFLAGEPEAIKNFHGEYLLEYSWGEDTLAKLCSNTNHISKDFYGASPYYSGDS